MSTNALLRLQPNTFNFCQLKVITALSNVDGLSDMRANVVCSIADYNLQAQMDFFRKYIIDVHLSASDRILWMVY
jgi:hypothetical protein